MASMATKVVDPKRQAQVSGKAPKGLGDAVEVVAKPVARALGIVDCGGCAKRKEALNRLTAKARAGVRRIFGG